MSRIVILYSSTDGHTKTISESIALEQQQLGHRVEIHALTAAPKLDEFDCILIGASIRYGKFQPSLFEFIRANQALLEQKNSGFFGVNVVARKPLKNRADTNPYMIKLFEQIDWQPAYKDVFAGRIDYPSYSVFDRVMIRFIMWITKGPTDTTQTYEFTDWQRVREFALRFVESKGSTDE
ncbi:menaquinone-dependent protoporphyrinogen IX dehydrogenase [Paraferrimonas haliotis]|uniref:Protoporphyrinogen IX dehydrogenase [quinone] n=1 Tax=Paraferrimonas haliotis TaxID=2013866 RepID=A0AA37U1Z2_9GAMM|nr:menaquinone-dependent protoporphyrinogen IX dehydrogenase [Paraferrimonas haliotis]GLS84821.1 oxygen-independent protoporphyrinogen oxidase HemG [Paraferrimonas haliotis]